MRSFLLVWIITIDSKSRDSYEKKEVKVLTWSQDQGTKFRYRSGTVNSKSFVGKVLLRIKWKFKLTVYFKHEILGQL